MKKCKNCHYYKNDLCTWEEFTLIPFWASIYDGDHKNYTEPEDGKNCRAFLYKSELTSA